MVPDCCLSSALAFPSDLGARRPCRGLRGWGCAHCLVREIVSKIQTMRKEAGFEVMDRITVYADGNDKVQTILKRNADSVLGDVMATALKCGETAGFVKEWNVNGETVTLGVEKND